MEELHEPPEFSVAVATIGGAAVVTVCGELDIQTAPELVDALIVGDADKPVVLDVRALTFIDSGGLHVLFGERGNGKPAALVVAAKSHVARVFDLVSASQVLFVCHDLETAIQTVVTPEPAEGPAVA